MSATTPHSQPNQQLREDLDGACEALREQVAYLDDAAKFHAKAPTLASQLAEKGKSLQRAINWLQQRAAAPQLIG